MRRRESLSLKFRPETKFSRGFVVTEPSPLTVVTQSLAIVSVPPTILRYFGRFGSLKTKRCQSSGFIAFEKYGQQLLKLTEDRKNYPWIKLPAFRSGTFR
jgi:hypothetical protein